MRPSLCAVIAAGTIVLCAGTAGSSAPGPDPPDVSALLPHLDDLYRSKSSVAPHRDRNHDYPKPAQQLQLRLYF